MIKLTLPIVPSVNHCYRNVSINRRILTPIGKAWQETAKYIAKAAAAKQGWKFSKKQKLVMEYWTYWPDNRIRDVHNQEKLLLDTLEGVLYDNDKWVLPRAMDFAVDKGNPRIEILLYPLEIKAREGWQHEPKTSDIQAH